MEFTKATVVQRTVEFKVNMQCMVWRGLVWYGGASVVLSLVVSMEGEGNGEYP